MTAPDLPDVWADEPWPLDPLPAPFRPTNWSDSHDAAPQVADLADAAWELAIDRGISLEQALVTIQQREEWKATMGPTIPDPKLQWANVDPAGYVRIEPDPQPPLTIRSVPIGVDPTWQAPPMPATWPKPDDPWVWGEPERDGDDLSVTVSISLPDDVLDDLRRQLGGPIPYDPPANPGDEP